MSQLMKITAHSNDLLDRVIDYVIESTDFMHNTMWPIMQKVKAHAAKNPVYGIIPDEYYNRPNFSAMEQGIELSLTMTEIAGEAMRNVAQGKTAEELQSEEFEALTSMIAATRRTAEFLMDCIVDYTDQVSSTNIRTLSEIITAGSIGMGLMKPARANRNPDEVLEQKKAMDRVQELESKAKNISSKEDLMDLLKDAMSDAHDCDNCDESGNGDIEDQARALKAQLGGELPDSEDLDMEALARDFDLRLMKDDEEEENLKNGKAPE